MIANMVSSRTAPIVPTSSPPVAPIPTVIPGERPVFQDIHDTGRRTLWVMVVLMGLTSLVFYVLTARTQLQKRVFHTLVSLTATISFLSYLAMSAGQGMVYKHADLILEHKYAPDIIQHICRQVPVVRYVNWILTSPLLLITLALLSGLPGAYLVSAIAADLFMFITGLLGTFSFDPSSRWVWYALSCIAYLAMVYHIGIHGQQSARNKGLRSQRFFGALAAVMLLARALYPITLAAGSVALRLSVDAEIVLFAIMDIFLQCLLGYWIIITHGGSSGIEIDVGGFWAHGIDSEGTVRIPDSHDDGP